MPSSTTAKLVQDLAPGDVVINALTGDYEILTVDRLQLNVLLRIRYQDNVTTVKVVPNGTEVYVSERN